MKFKITFSITLFLLLFAVENTFAEAYEAQVESQYAKVYENKDTDSKVLRTLTKGVEVVVLDVQDNWCYVSTNNNKGWILKSNLQIFYNKRVLERPGTTPVITKPEPEYTNPEPILRTNSNYSFRAGLKAGLSVSRVIGDYVVEENSKLRYGLSGGGFLIYDITENFGLQAELLYTQKGGKGPIGSEDVTIKLDYIELPIMLRYQLERTNCFYFNGGFDIAYNSNNAMVTSSKTYVFDDIKKIDYGIVIGAGCQFGLGNLPMYIDMRYYHGLTTVNDGSDPVDVKNTCLYFTIGIDLFRF